MHGLSQHVQFAQPPQPGLARSERRELGVVTLTHVLNVPQPVVDQTEFLFTVRRSHAAAAIVPADDDVAHAQYFHRVLDDRQAIQVAVHHDVGDVAMHEDLTGHQSQDLIRRHATVRAADP